MSHSSRNPIRPSDHPNVCPVPSPWEGEKLPPMPLLNEVISKNSHWMQGRTISTNEVLEALFPCLHIRDNEFDGICSAVNVAMYDAGFTPDGSGRSEQVWRWNCDERCLKEDSVRIPHGVLDQLTFQLLINEHSAWLQEKPRTTLELLERLDGIPLGFPWSYYIAWIKRLNLALWHAGYNPYPYDEPNPYWHGKPSINIRRQSPRISRLHASGSRNGSLGQPLESIRVGVKNRRTPVRASGTQELRERQAAYYLRIYNYKNAHLFDQPEFTLVKVVCNLRNYFGISQEETIRLVTSIFNPKSDYFWSRKAVGLVWELVANFNPSLGLSKPAGIAKQHAVEVEDAVTELLAYTRSGGRVSTDDFFDTLIKHNPDLVTTKTAVSRAVRDITGIKTTSYQDGRCFNGFHLPTTEELLDHNHSCGAYIDLPEPTEFWRGPMVRDQESCKVA